MVRNPVVYILCRENRRALYIGITTNLPRRLEEHRNGLVHHTAKYNIHRLIYVESYETASDAIAREKKLILINRANPEWRDLSGEVH